MLDKYDKEMYQRCRYCCCVIEIKKAFQEDKDTCNMCVKVLQNRDEINCKIYIIWSKVKSIGFLQTSIDLF